MEGASLHCVASHELAAKTRVDRQRIAELGHYAKRPVYDRYSLAEALGRNGASCSASEGYTSSCLHA